MVNITILGGGNGALTTAGDLTLAGHKVNLCEIPRFKASLDPVIEAGGIEMAGVARNGFAKLNLVTPNVGEAMKGAEVVLVVMPAYGHLAAAETLAPHIEDGQMIILHPGYSFGSVEFSKKLKEKGVDLKKIKIGATSILLYATRKYLGNKIYCTAVKHKIPFSALPSKNTSSMLAKLGKIFPQADGQRGILVDSENDVKLALVNANIWGHPPMMILKAIDVELGEEPYLKSNESNAKKLLGKGMNDESVLIQSAFGLDPWNSSYVGSVLMYPNWIKRPLEGEKPAWASAENQPAEYRAGGGFNFLKGRYITEDLPYGLVPISELGDLVKIPTPAIDSVITLGSIISESDFWKTGRTLKSLGLDGMTKEQLVKFITNGED